MEIKNAYSILEKYLNHEDNPYKISLIETAMKEYAEQFINLASEEAYCDCNTNNLLGINQESILKLKQLIK